MIIRPDPGQPSVDNMIEVVRSNSKRRVDVTFLDDNGDPVDILEETLATGDGKGELDLTVISPNEEDLYEETYWPTLNPAARRIQHPSTGKYYLPFGETGYEDETETTGTYLFNWHLRKDETTEDQYRTQAVEVVSPKILGLLPRLRLMLDKSEKIVCPEEHGWLGYTDSMLIMYLQLGLQYINNAEPYPIFQNLDSYPIQYHSELLIRAAAMKGLESQLTFAIDTDVPSYQDQGHSFVITHFGPIQSYLNYMRQGLDKDVQAMKLKYVNSGTLEVELSFNATYYAALSSAPTGATFFGWYTR